jgi:hypothetical protein
MCLPAPRYATTVLTGRCGEGNLMRVAAAWSDRFRCGANFEESYAFKSMGRGSSAARGYILYRAEIAAENCGERELRIV